MDPEILLEIKRTAQEKVDREFHIAEFLANAGCDITVDPSLQDLLKALPRNTLKPNLLFDAFIALETMLKLRGTILHVLEEDAEYRSATRDVPPPSDDWRRSLGPDTPSTFTPGPATDADREIRREATKHDREIEQSFRGGVDQHRRDERQSKDAPPPTRPPGTSPGLGQAADDPPHEPKFPVRNNLPKFGHLPPKQMYEYSIRAMTTSVLQACSGSPPLSRLIPVINAQEATGTDLRKLMQETAALAFKIRYQG